MPSAGDWAPHREGNFPTPSGKCEFKSSMAQGGNFVVPLFRQGYGGQQSGEPVDPLPHYIPPNENPQTAADLARRYPLSLISPKSHAFLNSNYGNLPAHRPRPARNNWCSFTRMTRARGALWPERRSASSTTGAPSRQGHAVDGRVAGPSHGALGLLASSNRAGATVHALTPTAFADLGRAPTLSDALVQVGRSERRRRH